MEYMESKMQDALDGSISQYEQMCDEITELRTKNAQLQLALRQKQSALELLWDKYENAIDYAVDESGESVGSVVNLNEDEWDQCLNAVKITLSQEALDAYVMSRLELISFEFDSPLYRLKDK